MNEASKSLIIVFPARHYASEFVEPREQPFNLPAPFVPSQLAPILRSGSHAIALVRGDQLNVIGCELFIERITVVGTIPDKSLGQSQGDSCIDGSLDKGDFMWASRSRVQGDWKTCSVRNCHELCTFAALGLSHFRPPFFATTNVPSMKHSDKSMSPRASRSCANASSKRANVPSLTQPLKRRKQVAYEGYSSGKSAHAAPVRRIHSTPSMTARSSCSIGLPRPSARRAGGGIRGISTAHCSSVSRFLLAISAPALPEIRADRYL
jgi:hypothetical protein